MIICVCSGSVSTKGNGTDALSMRYNYCKAQSVLLKTKGGVKTVNGLS